MVLFSLSLSAILTNVLGQTTYTCEVEVGDEYIFTFTTVNAFPFYKNLWGFSGMSVGDKIKIKITDRTEGLYYFNVTYDEWGRISSGESFNSTPEDTFRILSKDPTDLYIEGRWFVIYFVLTPVSDYLAAFAAADSYYSSSGNKLIYSSGSTQNIVTYDSNGVMSKNEFLTGGHVMAVLSRGGGSSSEIPGYDLPILIGLTAIAGVSIIYIVKKKMLKYEDSKGSNKFA